MTEDDPRATAVGLASAIAAYAAWGVLPLYFRELRGVPAPDIVAHRVVWSALFLAGLVTARRSWRLVGPALAPGARWRFVLSSACISANWLMYVWAVGHGQVLQASLGYFINPLFNVLLGRLVLGERLSAAQATAIGLAAVGVLIQGVMVGSLPWVSLALAASFGTYGLLRKGLRVDGSVAMLIETSIVAPVALAWLVWGAAPASQLGMGPWVNTLLVGTGAVTALPLLWFAAAARRLRLSTLGVLQYLSPTGQFLCGVFAFGEVWSRAQAWTFGLIWAGIGIYAVEAWRGRRG